MEHLQIQQAVCMKDNGKMINSMDMEQSRGSFIKSSIQGSFNLVKKLEEEDSNLKVDFMKEILLMDNFMDKANITLVNLGKFMKETLLIITWKAKVL